MKAVSTKFTEKNELYPIPYAPTSQNHNTFQLTSQSDKIPSFVAGTPDISRTQLVSHRGKDYFYKITAAGKPGQHSEIYIGGSKPLLAATIQ